MNLLTVLLLVEMAHICRAFTLQQQSDDESTSSNTLKCKYILISKSLQNFASNTNGLSGQVLNKLFPFTGSTHKLDLNAFYFRQFTDDCFNRKIVDKLDQIERDETSSLSNFVLFGLDLSENNLNDSQLELLLNQNPVFKYKINMIRYLNLSHNNLERLSSSNELKADDDELNFLNEYYLKPDESFYLLNRFFNLEILLMDQNPLINMNIGKIVRIFQKLKVLSLNSCAGGTFLNLEDDDFVNNFSKNQKVLDIYYLGLAQNSIQNLTQILSFTDNQTLNIDHFDLSSNRLSSFESIAASIYKFVRLKSLNLSQNMLKNAPNFNDLKRFVPSLNEINLKNNLLKDTLIESFKLDEATSKLNVKLGGNPLLCDCNSQWLLDLYDYHSQAKIIHSKHQLLNRKKSSKSDLNMIKLIYKRDLVDFVPENEDDLGSNLEFEVEKISQGENLEFNSENFMRKFRVKRDMEEISSHFQLDSDPNLQNAQLPRHKRPTNPMYESLVHIVDLDSLTCEFYDTQSFTERSKANQTFDEFDSSDKYDLIFGQQNLFANHVRLRSKFLHEAKQNEFVCLYKDHCDSRECDCCVFQHCHCRSICPAQCTCYFDAKKSQNIIDCAGQMLSEVPGDNPIESVTDIRLNSNLFSTVKSHSFFGYGQIKYLYMQQNLIESISSKAFEDLKFTLKLLNLAQNKLEYLNFAEFYNFVELEVLILSHNPLKTIDGFINRKSLPNFKYLYLSAVNMDGLSAFVQESRLNSNSCIKFRLKSDPNLATTTTTLKMTKKSTKSKTKPSTTTILFTTTSKTEQNLKVLIQDELLYNSFLNQTKPNNDNSNENSLLFYTDKFKFYYLPVAVFALGLLMSILIVFMVIFATKKDASQSKTNKPYYIATNSESLDDNDEPETSETENSELNSDSKQNSSQSKRFFTLFKPSPTSASSSASATSASSKKFRRACNRSGSLDSYDSVDDAAATVSVSRSVQNLSLNVFIYFHVNDNQYIVNHLLPCLKNCLTLVPETRYILKVQTGMHMNAFDYSIQTQSSSLNAYYSNTLVANILVLSESFSGLRPQIDSLMSVNKTSTISHQHQQRTLKKSFRNSSRKAFKIHLLCTNSYLNQTSSSGGHWSALTMTTTQNSSIKSNSLLKKLYDTTSRHFAEKKHEKQSQICGDAGSPNPYATLNHHYGNETMTRLSGVAPAPNDFYNAYAFDNHLRTKIEKYLENVCLKSTSTLLYFSKTNFSYVDYTKR